MPNNIIFNDAAENLKSQIYGTTSGGALTPLLVESDGTLNVTATISGTVTVTTGTVTITATDFDIRALNATDDSVSIGGYGFTVSTITITTADAALTNTEFDFETSEYRTYSFYIVNTGTETVYARLQVSPTTNETFYMNDKTTVVTLTQDQKIVLVADYFLQQTRLQLYSAATATAVAYFNAQN